MVDVFPSEELRAFLVRLYRVLEDRDFDAFRFGEPREVSLKGLDGRFSVYEVLG